MSLVRQSYPKHVGIWSSSEVHAGGFSYLEIVCFSVVVYYFRPATGISATTNAANISFPKIIKIHAVKKMKRMFSEITYITMPRTLIYRPTRLSRHTHTHFKSCKRIHSECKVRMQWHKSMKLNGLWCSNRHPITLPLCPPLTRPQKGSKTPPSCKPWKYNVPIFIEVSLSWFAKMSAWVRSTNAVFLSASQNQVNTALIIQEMTDAQNSCMHSILNCQYASG